MPRDHITSDDMLSFFGECNQCNQERVHIRKYDEVRDHIIRYREHIMRIEPNAECGKLFKNPKILMVSHSYEDFQKAIMKISSNAACGEDGISANLLKRLSLPISKIICKIFEKSLLEGQFPKNLKHAIICGVYKSGDKCEAKN